MPAALQDWLPEDHLVHTVSDAVGRFDLSKITEVYERETRDDPPFRPEMMVKVLMYGYCAGVTSSGKLARWLHGDVALRGSSFRMIGWVRSQRSPGASDMDPNSSMRLPPVLWRKPMNRPKCRAIPL